MVEARRSKCYKTKNKKAISIDQVRKTQIYLAKDRNNISNLRKLFPFFFCYSEVSHVKQSDIIFERKYQQRLIRIYVQIY